MNQQIQERFAYGSMRVTSALNCKDLATREPATPPPITTTLLFFPSDCCCRWLSINSCPDALLCFCLSSDTRFRTLNRSLSYIRTRLNQIPSKDDERKMFECRDDKSPIFYSLPCSFLSVILINLKTDLKGSSVAKLSFKTIKPLKELIRPL